MFKGVQVAVEEEVDGYCDRLSPVSIRSLRSLRKKVQRSYGNHSPAIAATTITENVVAAIAGEWFHMIAMIVAIAEVFFFFLSDRSDYSDGSDYMETGL